jgi:hypothetical protein
VAARLRSGGAQAHVEAVIAGHPQEVSRIRSGEAALHDFVIGRSWTGPRQADPAVLRDILRERLASPSSISCAWRRHRSATPPARASSWKASASLPVSAKLDGFVLKARPSPEPPPARTSAPPTGSPPRAHRRKVWAEGARASSSPTATTPSPGRPPRLVALLRQPRPIVLTASATGPMTATRRPRR